MNSTEKPILLFLEPVIIIFSWRAETECGFPINVLISARYGKFAATQQ
jgi:hypothetical protein